MLKHCSAAFAAAALVLLVTSCQTPSYQTRVFQLNTLSGFMRSEFAGAMTVEELKTRGNFGVGTFNDLDGEMVVLEGTAYQSNAKGEMRVADPSSLSPLSTLVFWQAQSPFALAQKPSFASLGADLQSRFDEPVVGYAIRIEGRFSRLALRSVNKQSKPYTNVERVFQTQSEYVAQNVEGTLVGFWFAPDLKNLMGSGFHLHFISADKKLGGHVLEVALERGQGYLMKLSESWLQLAYP
jgi:acetolactate decarboxylase